MLVGRGVDLRGYTCLNSVGPAHAPRGAASRPSTCTAPSHGPPGTVYLALLAAPVRHHLPVLQEEGQLGLSTDSLHRRRRDPLGLASKNLLLPGSPGCNRAQLSAPYPAAPTSPPLGKGAEHLRAQSASLARQRPGCHGTGALACLAPHPQAAGSLGTAACSVARWAAGGSSARAPGHAKGASRQSWGSLSASPRGCPWAQTHLRAPQPPRHLPRL